MKLPCTRLHPASQSEMSSALQLHPPRHCEHPSSPYQEPDGASHLVGGRGGHHEVFERARIYVRQPRHVRRPGHVKIAHRRGARGAHGRDGQPPSKERVAATRTTRCLVASLPPPSPVTLRNVTASIHWFPLAAISSRASRTPVLHSTSVRRLNSPRSPCRKTNSRAAPIRRSSVPVCRPSGKTRTRASPLVSTQIACRPPTHLG